VDSGKAKAKALVTIRSRFAALKAKGGKDGKGGKGSKVPGDAVESGKGGKVPAPPKQPPSAALLGSARPGPAPLVLRNWSLRLARPAAAPRGRLLRPEAGCCAPRPPLVPRAAPIPCAPRPAAAPRVPLLAGLLRPDFFAPRSAPRGPAPLVPAPRSEDEDS